MRDVYLSKRAANKLEKLLEFLASEWSIKVKRAFIVKLETAFTQISRHPESATKSDLVKGLHRFVLTKQTTIFYRL